MKKIKAVVLKNTTKLTNSEMKEIRGGWYENSSSAICSAACESGASKPYVEMDCRHPYLNLTCAISRDGYNTQAICVNERGEQVNDNGSDSCENSSLPPTR